MSVAALNNPNVEQDVFSDASSDLATGQLGSHQVQQFSPAFMKGNISNLAATPHPLTRAQESIEIARAVRKNYDGGTTNKNVRWQSVAAFVVGAALAGLGAFAIAMSSMTLGLGAILLGALVVGFGIYQLREKASKQDERLDKAAAWDIESTIGKFPQEQVLSPEQQVASMSPEKMKEILLASLGKK